MKRKKVYKNIAEEAFCQQIERAGYEPMKRGWPDFFCIDTSSHRPICVEVKDNAVHPLKKEQHLIMTYLASKGVPCFRWDLQTRILQPITEGSKRRPKRQRSHSEPNGKGLIKTDGGSRDSERTPQRDVLDGVSRGS